MYSSTQNNDDVNLDQEDYITLYAVFEDNTENSQKTCSAYFTEDKEN